MESSSGKSKLHVLTFFSLLNRSYCTSGSKYSIAKTSVPTTLKHVCSNTTMERHIHEVVDLCAYLHVEGSHLLAAYVYDFIETQDHNLIYHPMPDIHKGIPDGFMQQFFACIIGQCGNQSIQNTITSPTLNSFIQR